MTKYLLILLSLLMPAALVAQTDTEKEHEPLTAKKCFKAAPEWLMQMVSTSTRLDMIDYFESGLSNHSKNVFDTDCYITQMDDRSMRVVMGTDIDWQIFVLNPDAEVPIIGVIETIASPIADSSLHFYNSRWGDLDKFVKPEPTMADWVLPAHKKDIDDLRRAIPFVMAEYVFDPAAQTLTVTNNTAQYFADGHQPAELQWLKPQIVYRWDGKKFKMQK